MQELPSREQIMVKIKKRMVPLLPIGLIELSLNTCLRGICVGLICEMVKS